MNVKKVATTMGWAALNGAICFGLGTLAGHLFYKHPLRLGAIAGVSSVAHLLTAKAVDAIGEKFSWKKSTISFVKFASASVIFAASMTAMIALQIFNPLGMAMMAIALGTVSISLLAHAIQEKLYEKKLERELALIV